MAKRTVNLLDLTLRHQILVERYKNGLIQDIAPQMLEIEKKIIEMVSNSSLQSVAKLSALKRQLTKTQKPLYDKLQKYLTTELYEFTATEAQTEATILSKIVENKIVIADAADAIKRFSTRPLFANGKTLEETFSTWVASELGIVQNAVSRGFASGQTIDELIQTLRGTKKNNYLDGVLARSRRDTETIVRTLVQHASTEGRVATWQANSDLIKKYRLVATLDTRTSDICRSLDGEIYEIDKGPLPPLHPNCRTTVIPELDDVFAIFDKGATRASLIGPVDDKMTYYEWLGKQSADQQDQILGPTRGKLFRDGGLTAEQFAKLNVNELYQPLTLTEMRKLNAQAFKNANL